MHLGPAGRFIYNRSFLWVSNEKVTSSLINLFCHGGWWDLYIIGAVCEWVTKKWPPLLFVLPRWLVRFIYNRSCLSAQLSASPLSVGFFCPGLTGSVGSSLLYIFYEIAIFYDNYILGFWWIQINWRMYYMEECRRRSCTKVIISHRAECRRRKVRREKFTNQNCTVPTIHLGPAGRRPARA